MHRRPTHHNTNGNNNIAVTTTSTASTTMSSTHVISVMDDVVKNGDASHTTMPSKQPRRVRRRKVRSSPFSTSSSLFSNRISDLLFDGPKGDGAVKCLMILVAIVAVFILLGFVIVLQLLWQVFFPSSTSSFGSSSTSTGSNTRGLARTTADRQMKDEKAKPTMSHRRDGDFPDLPASYIYTIPNSMSHIGDKSDHYARLRKGYDEAYPYNPERSLQVTEKLREYQLEAVENPSYDIYNCPEEPPPGYPYEWNTISLLNHWNIDDIHPPSKIHQGLCVFDYRKDYVKALTYRQRELPFVVRGDPDVAQAVERWNSPGYIKDLMGNVMHRAEYSTSNHFLYWFPGNPNKPVKGKKRAPVERPKDWKEPTKLMRMTYADWLSHANVTDDSLVGPDKPHWYFRLIGCGEDGPKGECDAGSSEYLFDELTFFQPRTGLLYMVDPHEQKGIHCRFGMKGVVAENHFDGSRNAIVVLGGARRYILSHPNQCTNLALYPNGHPSARHSAVDWSHPDLDEFPQFANAKSNEVVLQGGDVLYLPTAWFHLIVSLSVNYQCNTRSGKSAHYDPPMNACGF